MTLSVILRSFGLITISTVLSLYGCANPSQMLGKLNPYETISTPQPPAEIAGEPQSEAPSSTPSDNTDIKDKNTESAMSISQDASSEDPPPDSTDIAHTIAEVPGQIVNYLSNDDSATDESENKIQQNFDQALDFVDVSQDFRQKGELDNALQALDQAYSMILSPDSPEDPKLIQQKDDIRYLIANRIKEIYASRHVVVNGIHKAIPITLNKHVQSEIDRFTKGRERSFFISAYKRSGRYRPFIVHQLKAAGLPESLSWLPLIESGFKIRALSKARALGLWQFIPSTGYKFGLNRDLYIDERLDPQKATDAAIAYFKELHNLFGDWTTVLAAYNCGEGKVLSVIRNQNINYLDNFWDLYERIPWETARYVPRFLATIYIVNHLEKYGLDKITPDPPAKYEVVEVKRQVYLKEIAKKLSVSAKALADLNPELRYKMLPADTYPLKVPAGKKERLLAEIDNIALSAPPRRAFVYHRIRRGETLSTIARKNHTSVTRIMRANNISRKHYIVAGQLLKIPQRGTYIPTPHIQASIAPQSAFKHTVKRGDSLWNLAQRYGTNTNMIMALNHLHSSNLDIGQVLAIPGNKNPKQKHGAKIYLVKSGDNPFTIAKQHNMSLKKLLRINSLSASSRIYPGQQLFVK